jgi:hypothetical protein
LAFCIKVIHFFTFNFDADASAGVLPFLPTLSLFLYSSCDFFPVVSSLARFFFWVNGIKAWG